MKLDSLLKVLAVESVAGGRDRDVTGVYLDSRLVRPGGLFVALRGRQNDGWDFAEDAIARGAACVVTEHEPRTRPHDLCLVRVRDAHTAVGLIAAAFHQQPAQRLKVVGITGTNGKTTTSYILRDLLRAAGLGPGLIGTVEYQVGERVIPASRTTPDAVALQALLAQMVNAGCGAVAMEVSSHALAQRRTAGIEFDVAVFTNLTRDHLDYHGTLDAYFETKARLFAELGTGAKAGVAVVNRDDPRASELLALTPPGVRRLTYGIGGGADVAAEDLSLGPDGVRFTLASPWGRAAVRANLYGRYNVSNILAAAAAAGALGVGLDTLTGVLPRLSAVPGRLEAVPNARGIKVCVDYAHTDDALSNVLRNLRELTAGRLIVVFGCGGNRDQTKRPAMGRVASSLADYSIVTSDNPRREAPEAIIAAILAGFEDPARVETIENRGEAIRRAIELARPGDTVLIAGKGHETFQELAHTTVPFDDRQIAARWLA